MLVWLWAPAEPLDQMLPRLWALRVGSLSSCQNRLMNDSHCFHCLSKTHSQRPRLQFKPCKIWDWVPTFLDRNLSKNVAKGEIDQPSNGSSNPWYYWFTPPLCSTYHHIVIVQCLRWRFNSSVDLDWALVQHFYPRNSAILAPTFARFSNNE